MDVDIASAAYIQAERILRIETPLGLDVLLPERMEMRERVNGLFQLSISVRSKRTDLKADELVGKLVDVSIETGEMTRKTWSGLVVALTEGPPVTRGLRAYQLTIVPQHWLMTQRSDCRIWLDKTSVEIAQILCSEHGLHAPVTAGIVQPPEPQHYSVQFNETDLAYLTRRLEEDGIFYWFEHEGGEVGAVAAKHTLHIASDKFGYTRSEDGDVRFAMGSTDRNHISKFEKTFRFIPGKRSMGDWNFLQPNGVPRGETPTLHALPGNADYDLYEFNAIGGYGTGSASSEIKTDRVEAQSRLRMQAAEVEHEKIDGQSNVRTLTPGRRFTPYDVANPTNTFEEHIVLEIAHYARDRSYETNEGDPEYVNTFLAIPSRVPATPHRTTPRPRIEGTQIAIIAGPSGEEIHTETHGRVKVWFPWDRRAKKDGSDTCWIRVAQNWGGPSFGGQIIPRIDMEAIVSFLDGDPDKPVIIGLVPNPRQKVPYELPANKTKSVFRTNTHKSKNPMQFNELSFEDKEGAEEIYLHAEKDHTLHIQNNRSKRVDNNQSESVGYNKSIEIGNNHSETIGGNMSLVIGANRVATFTSIVHKKISHALKDKADKILGSAFNLGNLAEGLFGKGNLSMVVGANKTETVAVSSTETVGINKASVVGGTRQDFTGGSSHTYTGQNKLDEAMRTITQIAGERWQVGSGPTKIVCDAEGKITIMAPEIEIIGKAYVNVKGKKVKVN